MSLIIPANSAAASGGYAVDDSLRFNVGSSDYLNRTQGTATSAKIFTLSMWVKISTLGEAVFFSSYYNSTNRFQIYFNANGTLTILNKSSGSTNINVQTNRVFRDISAWYNLIVAIDTTQGTDTNRVKLYVNGVQETSFSTATYPSVNNNISISGSNYSLNLGRYGGTGSHFGGYMSEVVFVDGTAQANTDLGEFDEDSSIWKPISVSGLTFGNNGFYQEYKQSGTGTDSSGMGADTSGNDNHFAVNNLTAIDQTTDTPTNNFCTLNALIPSNGTLTDGNLTFASSNSASNFGYRLSTIGVSSGKWYVECKPTSGNNASIIGIRSRATAEAVSHHIGYYADDYSLYVDGRKITNNALSAYGVSYTNADIIGIALDLDNNKLYFSKNGTFMNSGVPTSGATGTGAISITASSSSNSGNYFFGSTNWDSSNNGTWSWSFGNPSFAISSGNTDGNGYGNFEYAVPSGYYAINTKNLAEYG